MGHVTRFQIWIFALRVFKAEGGVLDWSKIFGARERIIRHPDPTSPNIWQPTVGEALSHGPKAELLKSAMIQLPLSPAGALCTLTKRLADQPVCMS
jgi:hypothetical protein